MALAQMNQSRSSRGARWGIGLSVTGFLLLVALCLDLGGLLGALGDPGSGDLATGPRRSAIATVLDVDAYDRHDRPVPVTAHWWQHGGRAQVDIDFRVDGDHEVTVLNWPTDHPADRPEAIEHELPSQGQQIRVDYLVRDPERNPLLLYSQEDYGWQAGSYLVPSSWPGLIGGGFGVAALLVLICTALWARRGAPSAARAPVATWNQEMRTWNPPPPSSQAGPTSTAHEPAPPVRPSSVPSPPDLPPPDHPPPAVLPPPVPLPPVQLPPVQLPPVAAPDAPSSSVAPSTPVVRPGPFVPPG